MIMHQRLLLQTYKTCFVVVPGYAKNPSGRRPPGLAPDPFVRQDEYVGYDAGFPFKHSIFDNRREDIS